MSDKSVVEAAISIGDEIERDEPLSAETYDEAAASLRALTEAGLEGLHTDWLRLRERTERLPCYSAFDPTRHGPLLPRLAVLEQPGRSPLLRFRLVGGEVSRCWPDHRKGDNLLALARPACEAALTRAVVEALISGTPRFLRRPYGGHDPWVSAVQQLALPFAAPQPGEPQAHLDGNQGESPGGIVILAFHFLAAPAPKTRY